MLIEELSEKVAGFDDQKCANKRSYTESVNLANAVERERKHDSYEAECDLKGKLDFIEFPFKSVRKLMAEELIKLRLNICIMKQYLSERKDEESHDEERNTDCQGLGQKSENDQKEIEKRAVNNA